MPTDPNPGDVYPEFREQCPATYSIDGVVYLCHSLRGHQGAHFTYVIKGDKSEYVAWYEDFAL